MSYMNAMRETENILSLVESIDAEYKKEQEMQVPSSTDNDPFGTVSLDDINDTVEVNDGPIEPESLVGDVDLTEQEKTIVRQHLKEMLDEIQGEDISEPALEMIIQEVAQNSAFLTEADEDRINSPVEKTQLIKAKIDAITAYAKELLGGAAENEGKIEDESTELPPEDPASTGEPESTEGGEPEVPSEPVADEPTDDKPVSEAAVVADEPAPVEDPKPVDEGVCTECGDAPVDVSEEDVIKVVDDSEVQPLEDLGGEAEVEGEYATKADIDEIKQMIQSLMGSNSAVLESVSLIKGADAIKNVEGGNPSMGTPSHSSAQKTSTPSYSQPGFKVAELKDLTSPPKKTDAGVPFSKENASNIAGAQPGFKKDSHDKGKSSSVPDGGAPAAQGAPKKNTPGVTNPSDAEKAAVLRESANKPARSWLDEARMMINKK